MKNVWVIAAAGTGLIALCAALTSWQLPADAALRVVGGELKRVGLTVESTAGGQFTLLPVPRVDLASVSLKDHDGDVAVEAETVRASVRLLSFLFGEPVISDLTLVRPRIVLAPATASGLLQRAAGLVPARTGGAGPRPVVATPDLRRIVIIDGSVASRTEAGSPPGRDPFAASQINAVFSADRAEDGFEVSASFAMQGDAFQLRGSGLQLAATDARDPRPLEIMLSSGLVRGRLSGRSTGGPNAQTDGGLLLKIPDAGRLADWLGQKAPLPLRGVVEVSGAMRLQPGSLSLTNLRVALPAGRFDGVLSLRQAGDRLALDGTVAAETLDLTEAVGQFLPAPGAEGWAREPYRDDMLPKGDADLRISAAKLRLGKLALDNAAISLLAHPGRIDAVLSTAEAYGGTVKARLSVAPAWPDAAPVGVEMKLAASFDKVDAGAVAAALAEQKRIAGIASGLVQIEGTGESPAALVASLEGKASANIRQGELIGINVPDLLRRLDTRPLATALELRGGRTSIETGAASARISKGVVDVYAASLNAAAAKVMFAGQIGLSQRQLNLTGAAVGAASGPALEQVALPFSVVGPLEDPQIVPDAGSVIRRPGDLASFVLEPPAALTTGRIQSLAPVNAPGP